MEFSLLLVLLKELCVDYVTLDISETIRYN